MQIRVICCVPRGLPRSPHFSQPVKQNWFTITRPIPMLLRLLSQQHSTANRKKRSSSSSVRTGTSSHGNHQTCRVYPGDYLSTVCDSTRKRNLLKSISVGPPRRRERPWRGSGSAPGHRVHPRDLPLRVAHQCCYGSQEEQFTPNVY